MFYASAAGAVFHEIGGFFHCLLYVGNTTFSFRVRRQHIVGIRGKVPSFVLLMALSECAGGTYSTPSNPSWHD